MITYTDTAKAVWQAGLQKQLTLALSSGVTLTNSDILMESMSLKQSCNEDEQFAIGNVYSSEFTVTVFNDAPASAYVGYTLTPTLTAIDSEDNEYPQQLGVFTVESAKRTSDRIYRELVCYDKLSPILKTDYSNWYNALSFPMTVKLLRDAFFAFVGIEQETITLPNDSITVQLKYPFETLSGADLLHSICEVNGAWGFMDYAGKFKYVLPTVLEDNRLYPAETLYPSEILFPGGTMSSSSSEAYIAENHYVQGTLAFEEFTTAPITAVTVYQTTGEISVTSGTEGNTYTLTDNVLLYFVGEAVMQTVADNILANLDGFTYVPVSVKTPPVPWVEPGDWVSFDCDHETMYFPVMQRTFSGITAVMDTFTATGTEYIQENANSVESRVASVEATARETGNYFWVDTDGAHVTQVPKSDIVADGWDDIYNSLITSTEFQIRYGETPLATFGEEVTIGNEEDSALHLTKDSVTGKGGNGKFFFEFSGNGTTTDVIYSESKTLTTDDVRSDTVGVILDSSQFKSGSSNGRVVVTLRNGSAIPIGMPFTGIVFGTAYSNTEYHTYNNTEYRFTVVHSAETTTIACTISPASILDLFEVEVSFAYTNSEPSPTYAIGGDCNATGAYSLCDGYGNISAYDYQTVVGRYNDNKTDDIFEVGYGTGDAYRRNLFEVSPLGISAMTHSSPIGTIVTNSTTTSMASASSVQTYFDGASIDLTTGTWVIVGQWQINQRTSRDNTNMEVNLFDGTNVIGRQRVNVVGTAATILQAMAICEVPMGTGWVEQTKTITVRGSSGYPVTGDPCPNTVTAVRII